MSAAARWPVLVVDDDRSTLDVTRMALDRVVVDGRRLELVTCQSAGAARELLAEREFALAIVDVVMETHRAGLELVREMRAEPRHQLTQIVVRTGEPGEYPEAKVIEDFRISDYWPKAELRAPRMRASVIGLVRAHATALSLDAQVREKETLLREVHHRVKNNLQILLGLLALQGEGVDPATRHKLEETAGRIRSMALVHRELYQHESLVAIDAGTYVQTLATELARTFDDSVELRVDAETVLVGVDVAVPMGLIVNELLTNAVKHGRSSDGTARVTLSIARSEEGLRLAVEDRGPGWTGEAPVGHLGQQLIAALARQLRARVTREHAGGASGPARAAAARGGLTRRAAPPRGWAGGWTRLGFVTKARAMSIADLRKDYARHRLDEDSVLSDPVAQFRVWLDEAIAAQCPEPTAMALSTVDAGGRPSSRMVLLKGVDAGFVFYTNYESRKGRELFGNEHACLLFFWPELERQVRIEGTVQAVAPEESDAYYRSRPLPSRLGAWASPQSQPISSAALVARVAEATLLHGLDPSRPPFWGGYRLTADRIELWQGRPSRLHDRLRYTREGTAWTLARLAP